MKLKNKVALVTGAAGGLGNAIALGRLGTVEEYASLAVYLAADGHYLIGQVISPNGGAVI